jgi:hypothetical protein
MIPDEIRKKAEAAYEKAEHYDGNSYTSSEFNFNKKPVTFYELITEVYLQCYRDIISGEPDGWIARNLNGSFYYLSCGIDKSACESNLLYWKNSEEKSDDEKLAEYKKEGWQVVPVKLVRCGDE